MNSADKGCLLKEALGKKHQPTSWLSVFQDKTPMSRSNSSFKQTVHAQGTWHFTVDEPSNKEEHSETHNLLLALVHCFYSHSRRENMSVGSLK